VARAGDIKGEASATGPYEPFACRYTLDPHHGFIVPCSSGARVTAASPKSLAVFCDRHLTEPKVGG